MSTVKKPLSEDGKPLEIERRFLIEFPDIRWLEESPDVVKADITQVYYDTDSEKRLRVRKWVSEGNKKFFLNKKERISDMVRIEEEWEINEKELHEIPWKDTKNKRIISKTRYAIPYAGRTVEVDVFPFWDDKAIAEVEMESEDEDINLPDEIKVIREVTEERAYTNYSMAAETDFTENSDFF